MEPKWVSKIIRGVLAAACVASFLIMAPRARESSDGPFVFLQVALILLAALFVIPELMRLVMAPISALVDSFFFPGGRFSKPVLNYKLPEFYVEKGRYEEALAEYRKILQFYPAELPAYEGAIELLLKEFDDVPEAAKLYRQAQKHLHENPEAGFQLTNLWNRLAPTVKPPVS